MGGQSETLGHKGSSSHLFAIAGGKRKAWCRPEEKLPFAMWKALPSTLWTAQRVNIAEEKAHFVTHMGFRKMCGEDGEKGWPIMLQPAGLAFRR
jgi:hypothetical protein